jgi:hypothetical protein
MCNVHQMSEDGLPHTELEFMQHVHHEHQEKIETEGEKAIGKCVLDFISYNLNIRYDRVLTRVGTSDSELRIDLTRLPSTGAPRWKISFRA